MLGPAEYAIALPLSTETVLEGGLNQKSIYVNEIVKSHSEFERYLADVENADLEMKEGVFELIRAASQIATHPNLVYPVPISSSGAPSEREALFLTAMSSKFRFLKELFGLIRQEDVKVAIVAEAPGLIVRDLLVSYTPLPPRTNGCGLEGPA